MANPVAPAEAGAAGRKVRRQSPPAPASAEATEIGELQPHEADQAVALWHEANLLRPWNDPHADIAAALVHPTATILAAREGDRIVATVMAGYDGHRGWLYYLAVAQDRRRTGLGRAIVQAAETWLQDQGAPAIRLMVRAENTHVTGFYRALGYTDDGLTVLGKRLGG